MQPKIDKSRHLHSKETAKKLDEISQNFQNQVFGEKINCIQSVDCLSFRGYHEPHVQ